MTFKNNKTKTYLVVGLSLAAILVSSSSLGAVFAQVTTPNTVFSAQEDEIPADIQQQVSKMPAHSKHATFLNIEKKVHGFSGIYLDDTGVLNVYTTDPSIKSVDKSVFADYVDPQDLAKGIVVKQSKHSWHKWMQLENIVLELFNNKSLGVTSMDVDDKNQVYEIGLEKLDDSKKDMINKFLAMHDIPQDMIKLKETGKIIPVGGGTGSTYTPGPTIRPIEGGLQIGVSPSFGSCTIGFIAKTSSGSTVGTTAGHCVDGGRTNAANQKYTQPYSSNANDYTTNAIASVIASSDKAPPRYSDTLLFTPSVSTNLGKIYNGGPVLTVTGKDYSPYVGKAVSAFGSTSGTGSGTITKTGVVYSDSALGGLVYGQVEAPMSPIPYPNPGDSGGPVWSTNPDSTITLEGTMVARSIDNSQVVLIFSPISGIEFDQGVLQVN